MRKTAVLLIPLLLTACARNTPVDPAVFAPPSASAAGQTHPDHVVLPQDDAPHDDLTEWWYYTGHLQAADGRTFGFELVTFQAVRSTDPPAYAAHFAITDNAANQFRFEQKSEAGPQVHEAAGFDLNVGGWIMKGGGGHDHLTANLADYGIDLDLNATKPAVLHDGKGLISFGAAGDSYYYSRTRMAIAGTMTAGAQPMAVTGTAWMDHQWGNFVSGGGGWDWFAIQMDDNTELMLFFLRDASGKPTLPYGTYVAGDGSSTILPRSAFAEQSTGSWTSPHTGITYPSGWQVTAGDAQLTLTPTIVDQELSTLQTTGITYWEGDVNISGTKAGAPIGGQGYTELVGYK